MPGGVHERVFVWAIAATFIVALDPQSASAGSSPRLLASPVITLDGPTIENDCTARSTPTSAFATTLDEQTTTAPAAAKSAPVPSDAAAPAYGPVTPNFQTGNFKLPTDYAISLLPPSWSDGLYVDLWAWTSYSSLSRGEDRSYWDGELSLEITKSFAGQFALTGEINFIDANDQRRGELEQAFGTALLSPDSQAYITAGKFNANIGVEARDFWNRVTSTTSLLYGAEPQDFLGIMLSVPIGNTGLDVRPFLVTNFNGRPEIRSAPAGGLLAAWHPSDQWSLSLTNWVGPGYRQHEESYSSGYGNAYGRASSYSEQDEEDEDYGAYSGAVLENWLGPTLHGDQSGTLYLVTATATWRPARDLTLQAQGLFANSSSHSGSDWSGCMALANYDFTDKFRLFGMWSFLNDPAGIVTGVAQRHHELSTGVAFKIYGDVEIRGEYRHDFSNATGDLDSLTADLTFRL